MVNLYSSPKESSLFTGAKQARDESAETRDDDDAEQFIESTETVQLSEELVIAGATPPDTTTQQPEVVTITAVIFNKTDVQDTTINSITTTNDDTSIANMEPRITTTTTPEEQASEDTTTLEPIPLTTIRSTMALPTPVLTTTAKPTPPPTTGIRIVGVGKKGVTLTTSAPNGPDNIDDGLLDLLQETTLPPLAFGARLSRRS